MGGEISFQEFFQSSFPLHTISSLFLLPTSQQEKCQESMQFTLCETHTQAHCCRAFASCLIRESSGKTNSHSWQQNSISGVNGKSLRLQSPSWIWSIEFTEPSPVTVKTLIAKLYW
jgi:hypothetical protein